MGIKSVGFGGRIFTQFGLTGNLVIGAIGALLGVITAKQLFPASGLHSNDGFVIFLCACTGAFIFLFIGNIIHVLTGTWRN